MIDANVESQPEPPAHIHAKWTRAMLNLKIHQKNLLRAQFMTNKQQRCKRPHRHPSSLRWCLASIDGTPRWALSGTLFHGGINPLLAGLIWPRQGLLWTQVCPWTHHGRRGPPRPLRCCEPADVLGGPTVCGSAAPFSNYSYCIA